MYYYFLSLGYAFCTFENHDTALKCLRVLNNHPSIFSKEKRPIVEFAVENAKAVKLLADRRNDLVIFFEVIYRMRIPCI